VLVQGSSNALSCAAGVVVDSDVDTFGDPERRGISSLFVERLTHDLHLLGELCSGLRAGAKETAGVLHCATQRVGMTRTKPDRRMRFLEWLWLHRGAIELPETSLQQHPPPVPNASP